MRKALLFVIIFILMSTPVPAFATTYYADDPIYVTTSASNTTVTQYEILWGVAGTHDAAITSATVKLQVQAGDNVVVNWCDSSGYVFDTSNVNTGSSTVNLSPPSGAYGARLVLTSGSTSGSRYAWWSSVTNSQGNTTIFPDPDTGGEGGETNIDLSPVVNALQVIQGQLTDIQASLSNSSSSSSGQLDNIITAINTQTSEIMEKIDDVAGQLSTIQGKLDGMAGQLNTISGKLTSIQGKLDDIDSNIVSIYDYISTPRTSQPFTLSMPEITFDPTPPAITEAPQQPYTYNKVLSEMPPFIDSPEPLPFAPDPVAMIHDPATEVDQPRNMDSPLVPDPVTGDSPRQIDPVTKDSPQQVDPVTKDTPRQIDPDMRDTPRTIDSPISRDNPIQTDSPISRDDPISPAPPLVPDTPR